MNKTLPERPDLGQLKKQAKDLLNDIRAHRPEAVARVPQNEIAGFALADAQRIIAREYGFPGWAKLKLHIETREIERATARLVIATAHGDAAGLQALLTARPELARQTVPACAVLGDLEGLTAWAAKSPGFATAKGGVADAEALVYVCLGRLGGDEAARVACAEFLLAHGADPNATWRESPHDESRLPVLYGATGRNNYPALARQLLAAGANPNDGESIYHAAENHHPGCLEALVAAGGDISRRNAKWTNTPLYFLLGGSPRGGQASQTRSGILWLLDHGADPNVPSYQHAELPLHRAIQNGWDTALIEAFLARGARPDARRADGRSLWVTAVRAGRADVLALLQARGAKDDATPVDAFLGALSAGDRERAFSLLADGPAWRDELRGEITELLAGASRRDETSVLALAAELGLDFDQPAGPERGRPLHWAAWHGRVAAVNVLIKAGADLNKPDGSFHAPPLGWCVHGSINCRAIGGDYAGVAEALLAAGAKRVEDGGAAPEVIAVFRRYAGK